MKKLVDNFLYEQESYQIIGAAREVWRELGGAFKEKIADKAFSISLKSKGLAIENQKRVNVYFKEQIVGVYVPDMIVNDCILIELKCKDFIAKVDFQQLWHYLKATRYKLGFVINFSNRGLQFKRVVYDTARKVR